MQPLSRRVLISSLLICAVAGVDTRVTASEVWELAPPLPAAKQHAFGLLRSGTLFAIGGTPWVNGSDHDATVFLFANGSWSEATPLDGIGPTIPIGGGVDGLGRILFFGGVSQDNGDAGPAKTYDPLSGPQGSIASPPSNLQRLGFAFATDEASRIYWLGGGATPASNGACARYDALTNAWTTLPTMPAPVRDACACSDGAGHILVFGGLSAGGSVRTTDVKQFDIATGTWSTTAVPDLPAPISGARAVLGADQRVYVLGGTANNGQVRATVDALNLRTNAWESAAPLATARQQFAAARGSDNYIYAIGGTAQDGSPLNSVERIFTATCPQLSGTPVRVSAWVGQTVGIAAAASGTGTITYAWTKDGAELQDGSTGTGSVLFGTSAATLHIANAGSADAGLYGVIATNSCGTTTGDVAQLSLRAPPAVPAHWTITNLHPSWANSSSASCLDGALQGGTAIIDVGGYSNVSQPVIWRSTAESALNVTPPGSVGGAIASVEGGTAAGWWWWGYACSAGGQQSTCYTAQAALWTGLSGSTNGGAEAAFINLQRSGWEYSYASAIRNGVVGGHVVNDDSVGNYWWHAVLWSISGSEGADMQPIGTSSSSVDVIDGAEQYGSILTPYPGPTYHAAVWTGSASSFIDLHPAGTSASFITDAADGLVVGYTGYPYDGARACLWSHGALAAQGGSSAQDFSFIDLHPAGATLSHAYAVRQGIIIGDATIGGVTTSGYWRVGSTEFHSLDADLLPSGFSSISIVALQVSEAGDFTMVGEGYRTAPARREALMWRSVWPIVGDLNGDGLVDGADLGLLLGSWGSQESSADLNQDGTVDGADLGLLLGAWGG